METSRYDKIIIGAGIYGLYSALYCCRKGQKVLILECDRGAFSRATYINQARVHQGYHYPRSISTAQKTALYFERFSKDFSFCINTAFDQVYATSSKLSWTSGSQFKDFCRAAGIPCEEVNPEKYFKPDMCDGCFLTREYTYDAMILKDYFLKSLEEFGKAADLRYGVTITSIEKSSDVFRIGTDDGNAYEAPFILNATYAGTNQILELAGYDLFKIKYELCEIILCETNDALKNVGITVMDGPFFSIMPFGKTGMHSLTAVSFTPHLTSFEKTAVFPCQDKSCGHCSPKHLGNCNECPVRPESAFPYMSGLARKYMSDTYCFEYNNSLFSMKPILTSSEIDDSRPTVIKTSSEKPYFVSILSGKINTIYDIDEVLDYGI